MPCAGTILIVDRDAATRELLRELMVEDGYDVLLAADRAEALAIMAVVASDVIVADLSAGIVECGPRTAVVLLAASNGVDEAVAACKRGAYDYVLRPFYAEDLSLTVACAVASRSPRRLDRALAHVRKNHELLG